MTFVHAHLELGQKSRETVGWARLAPRATTATARLSPRMAGAEGARFAPRLTGQGAVFTAVGAQG